MPSLPTFLLIGAAKSGTTSLYRYLGQHPEVFVSPVKEPNFFAFEGEDVTFCGPGDERCNRSSVTSLSDYRRLFDATDASVRGEASPSSLYYPRAPKRIDRYVPDARLISILRDPVERAYSNFLMMMKMGREPHRDFATALDEEPRRLEAGWSYFWGYTRLGFYYEQLRRFYDRFDPGQIRVCLFDDFTDDPEATVRGLYRFLGVDDTFVPDTSLHYNPGGLPRSTALERLKRENSPVRRLAQTLLPSRIRGRIASTINRWNRYRPPMPDDVRRRLRDLYRDDILRLQGLIDRDLSHWLRETSASA